MTSKFKCHDNESIPLIAWDSFWKNWKPNEDLNIEGRVYLSVVPVVKLFLLMAEIS